MAREKFQTLTEQMFYVLLTLREECCGTDVMARISNLTQGRVTVGPGTLYNLLDSFQAAGWIMETKTEGHILQVADDPGVVIVGIEIES